MSPVYSRSPIPDYSSRILTLISVGSRVFVAQWVVSLYVGGRAVQWASHLQPHTTLSSTESEYTTASSVGCEIM